MNTLWLVSENLWSAIGFLKQSIVLQCLKHVKNISIKYHRWLDDTNVLKGLMFYNY